MSKINVGTLVTEFQGFLKNIIQKGPYFVITTVTGILCFFVWLFTDIHFFPAISTIIVLYLCGRIAAMVNKNASFVIAIFAGSAGVLICITTDSPTEPAMFLAIIAYLSGRIAELFQ